MVVFRRAIVIIATGTLGFTGFAGTSFAQSSPPTGAGEPSSRVGRLAYLQGTVSFHDDGQSDWQPALLNTPITTGDALWTEPNARSEVSIAGTRVRLDSATLLDMVALDDQLTRMELEQGRVDIKTFHYDTRQPYEVITPRGIVTIQQQGDYYVEAGTTQDPTRLGVREGAAQFATANGQTVAVRAGEVLEISGDGSAPQLSTIKSPPPPMPTQWAQRDREVSYDKAPEYLSTNVTGYEDLNRYGTWQNDPEYGQVWYANSQPAGWAPYTTGRWVSDPSYGWTWVDEQPWGFAPYHYGRWAERNNRWFWVPPDRQQPAVYAPALVAFIGGLELGTALGVANRQPVGWFPLGPREVYVPPYSMNRDYYRRINFSARVQQNILEDRWQRLERREALREEEQRWMNRRFARVVSAEDFARSRPVQRALMKVAADRLSNAPVAFISAPPRPNESIRALLERREDRRDAQRAEDRREDRRDAQRTENRRDEQRTEDRRDAQRTEERRDAQRTEERRDEQRTEDRRDARRTEDRRDAQRAENRRDNDVNRRSNLIGLAPEPERAKAPGPQIAERRDTRGDTKVDANKAGATETKQALPQLAPRNASAPPQAKLEGDRRPTNDATRAEQGNDTNRPANSDRAGSADRERAAAPDRDRADGADRDRANRRDEQPGQATLPPVRDRNEKRPDAPQTGEQRPNQSRDAAQPQSGQKDRDDDAVKRPTQAQRPAEPSKADQPDEPKRPQVQRQGEAAKPEPAAEPKRPTQAQRPAESGQAGQPAEPRRQENRPQAEPAKPQQAQQPQQQPRQPEPPKQQAPQQQRPDRQGMNTPPAQRQQQEAQAPRPQRQAQEAPRPQPQPQQAQAPRPQPQPQQAQAPRPQQQQQPQQAQAPRPQQQQPQQAQAPRAQQQPQPQQAQAPRPQQQQQPQQAQRPQQQQNQQQAQAPAPQRGGGNQKNDRNDRN